MSEAVDEKTGAEAPETGVKAADAGQEDMQGTEKQEKSKPGWDELMADPEYKSCFDSRVQEIVRKRLRDRHGSEEIAGRSSSPGDSAPTGRQSPRCSCPGRDGPPGSGGW